MGDEPVQLSAINNIDEDVPVPPVPSVADDAPVVDDDDEDDE